MKKLSCLILGLILIFSSLIGCGKKAESYEVFINKLISPKTYENIDRTNSPEISDDTINETNQNGDQIFSFPVDEDIKKLFDDCLEESALNHLMANTYLYMYADVIKAKNITEVKDVKISDVKKVDKTDFTYVTCKVTYVYVTSDKKSIDMEENFSFQVKKDTGKVGDINFSPSNSIFKLFNELPK